MIGYISRQIKSDLTKLGIYQVIGGSMGVLMVAWLGMPRKLDLLTMLGIIMLAFFCYSIFCGILCLQKKESALRHSQINHYLQLICFGISGFAYQYASGVYLVVGLDLTDSFIAKFGVGISHFVLHVNSDTDQIVVKLNIVALILIFWIDKLTKKVKAEKALHLVSAFGEN